MTAKTGAGRILSVISRLAATFYHHPRAFMDNYGANVAGCFWNAGNVMQLTLSIATLTPRAFVSSIFNISASSTAQFFGHKLWGVPVASALAIIGVFLAVYPGFINGEPGIIGGFFAFAVFQCFGLFGLQLAEKFGTSTNSFIRHTLGNPRRVLGLMTFAGARVPIICESLLHSRWDVATLFTVWGMGDLIVSLSKQKVKGVAAALAIQLTSSYR